MRWVGCRRGLSHRGWKGPGRTGTACLGAGRTTWSFERVDDPLAGSVREKGEARERERGRRKGRGGGGVVCGRRQERGGCQLTVDRKVKGYACPDTGTRPKERRETDPT